MIHYLDQADIAHLLGIKPQTVRAWRVRGKLPEPDCMLGDRPGWLPDNIHSKLRQHSNGNSSTNGSVSSG